MPNDSPKDSKQAILEAAAIQFAEAGFAGARTERIARLAGVNKQLIYYYFGSKAGLYREVLRLRVTDLARRARIGGHPERSPERLKSYLGSVFDLVAEDPTVAQLMMGGLWDSSSRCEPIRTAVRDVHQELGRGISAGQGIGIFRDDADPDRIAALAVVLVLGFVALEPALGYPTAPADRARWLDAVYEVLLPALSW